MSFPEHGSQVAGSYEALGLLKPLDTAIIDMSVNLNPLGPPPWLQEVVQLEWDHLLQYPEQHGESLITKVAAAECIDPAMVLLGNGGAELIYLVARLFTDGDVGIFQPTFSEYEQALVGVNARIQPLLLHEENGWRWHESEILQQLQDLDGIFLCNPNNPTGVAYSQEDLCVLVEVAAQRGILLIVDEAFYDFQDVPFSLVPWITQYPNLIVLRSFTKMYHVPGLRLGALFANPSIITRLRRWTPPWNVNHLALFLGKQLLEEQEYVLQTQQYVQGERRRIFAGLEKLGFNHSPSVVHYYLLSLWEKEDLTPLLKHLALHGIVARHTYNFPPLQGRYLRLAIKGRKENDRLLQVLEEWSR